MNLLTWLAAIGTAVLVHHGWNLTRRGDRSPTQIIRHSFNRVIEACPEEIFVATEYKEIDYVLRSREVHLNTKLIPSKKSNHRCLNAIHNLLRPKLIQSLWLHLDAETSGFPMRTLLETKRQEIEEISKFFKDIVISFHRDDWEEAHWPNICATLFKAESFLEWFAVEAPFFRESQYPATFSNFAPWDNALRDKLQMPHLKDRIWAVSYHHIVTDRFIIDDLIPPFVLRDRLIMQRYQAFLEQTPLKFFLPLDLTAPTSSQNTVDKIAIMCFEHRFFCRYMIYQFGNNVLEFHPKHVLEAISRLDNEGVVRFGLAPAFWRYPETPCKISKLRFCGVDHSENVDSFILDVCKVMQSKPLSRLSRQGFERREGEEDGADDHKSVYSESTLPGSSSSLDNGLQSSSMITEDYGEFSTASPNGNKGSTTDYATLYGYNGDEPTEYAPSDHDSDAENDGEEGDFGSGGYSFEHHPTSSASSQATGAEMALETIQFSGKASFMVNDFPFTVNFTRHDGNPQCSIHWWLAVEHKSCEQYSRDPTLAIEMRLDQ